MNNSDGALAGLFALEDEAELAHKRVASALEGARVLLFGAHVLRYGKKYQITALRAYRGIVHAYGVRIYDGRIGVRDYDLNDFRDCEIINYRHQRDAELPSHNSPVNPRLPVAPRP